MKWDSIKNLSHLVVIGTTNHELIAPLLALSPAKTTLFAADVAQSKQLQQYTTNSTSKNATNSNVVLKHALIATAKETVVWYQYNLPQLSAVAPANKALETLFPGLKLQQKSELETTDIAAELKTLNLIGQQNMLLLSSPAQNLALLQRLVATGQLAIFSTLVVQHTNEVFYSGAAALSELTDYLTEQGYQLLCSDQTDPDFPMLQFYRDAAAEALKQNQLKIKELTEQLASSQQQVTSLRSELDSTNLSLRDGIKLAEEHQMECRRLVEELSQTKTSAKLDEKQFIQSKAALSKQLDESSKQLQIAAQEKQKLAEQVQELSQQLKDSEKAVCKQLDESSKQLQLTTQEKQKLAEQVQELSQQLKDSEKAVCKQLNESVKQLQIAAQEKQKLAERVQELSQQLKDSEKAVCKQLNESVKQLQIAAQEKQKLAERVQELTQQLKDNEKSNQLLLAEKQSQHVIQINMTNELKSLKNELKDVQDALSKKESEKELLALKILNLINENESTSKVNELLRREIQKIEVQMDLLKELIKLPE